MTDCATCPHHVEVAKDISVLQSEVKHTRELLDIQIEGVDRDRRLAKEEMERRLEGMNGLEARSNARIVEAETRARDTTNKAEKKLEDQAKEFMKTLEFRAEMKVIETKLSILSGLVSEKKGEKKWSDHILTVLIAAGVMLLIHFLFKF